MTPTASPEEEPQPPAASKITVLLVDDQRMIGEVVRRFLEDQLDMAFHYCADPAEALVRANEVQPDVILQDLVMPKIDGLELVRQYRANLATSATPIIVLSGSDDPTPKTAPLPPGRMTSWSNCPRKAKSSPRSASIRGKVSAPANYSAVILSGVPSRATAGTERSRKIP